MVNDSSQLTEIFKVKRKKNWRDDLSILWQLSRPYLGRLVAAIFFSLILSGIMELSHGLLNPLLTQFFLRNHPDI